MCGEIFPFIFGAGLRPRRQSRKCSGGFTLVELLVVMGIIAILVAIALPAYNMAMSQARKAKCSMNLRNIGVAMFSFANDNNNNLPESGTTIAYGSVDSAPPAGSGLASWSEQLQPYIGTDKTVFQCPDSSKIISVDATYSYFNGAHAAIYQSGVFSAVNLLKMQARSQHIIAGDVAFPGGLQTIDADKDDYTQDPAFGSTTGGGNTSPAPTISIHNGSVNLLFGDGHVQNAKTFDKTSMTTVYNGLGYNYLP